MERGRGGAHCEAAEGRKSCRAGGLGLGNRRSSPERYQHNGSNGHTPRRATQCHAAPRRAAPQSGTRSMHSAARFLPCTRARTSFGRPSIDAPRHLNLSRKYLNCQMRTANVVHAQDQSTGPKLVELKVRHTMIDMYADIHSGMHTTRMTAVRALCMATCWATCTAICQHTCRRSCRTKCSGDTYTDMCSDMQYGVYVYRINARAVVVWHDLWHAQRKMTITVCATTCMRHAHRMHATCATTCMRHVQLNAYAANICLDMSIVMCIDMCGSMRIYASAQA